MADIILGGVCIVVWRVVGCCVEGFWLICGGFRVDVNCCYGIVLCFRYFIGGFYFDMVVLVVRNFIMFWFRYLFAVFFGGLKISNTLLKYALLKKTDI